MLHASMLLLFEILLLVSFLFVVRVILKIRRQQSCISEIEMKNYILGRDDKQSTRSESFTVHLASCKKCQDLKERILHH